MDAQCFIKWRAEFISAALTGNTKNMLEMLAVQSQEDLQSLVLGDMMWFSRSADKLGVLSTKSSGGGFTHSCSNPDDCGVEVLLGQMKGVMSEMLCALMILFLNHPAWTDIREAMVRNLAQSSIGDAGLGDPVVPGPATDLPN